MVCYFQKISVILFGMFSNPGILLEGESLLKISFFLALKYLCLNSKLSITKI